MIIIAAKLYAANGIPLPRHREITMPYTSIGEFTMCERIQSTFKRNMMVASLSAVGGGPDVFPCLYDAAIIWVKGSQLRVRGFEIDPITNAHTAMVWGAEILEDQRRSTLLTHPSGNSPL